jgi:hypothetical protein
MKKKTVNSSRMPVYRDAGFELYDACTTKDAFASETGNERIPEFYIYSRYSNPTVVSAEEEVMKLEESEWALLTQRECRHRHGSFCLSAYREYTSMVVFQRDIRRHYFIYRINPQEQERPSGQLF